MLVNVGGEKPSPRVLKRGGCTFRSSTEFPSSPALETHYRTGPTTSISGITIQQPGPKKQSNVWTKGATGLTPREPTAIATVHLAAVDIFQRDPKWPANCRSQSSTAEEDFNQGLKSKEHTQTFEQATLFLWPWNGMNVPTGIDTDVRKVYRVPLQVEWNEFWKRAKDVWTEMRRRAKQTPGEMPFSGCITANASCSALLLSNTGDKLTGLLFSGNTK